VSIEKAVIKSTKLGMADNWKQTPFDSDKLKKKQATDISVKLKTHSRV
jgi:hypothetical protein